MRIVRRLTRGEKIRASLYLNKVGKAYLNLSIPENVISDAALQTGIQPSGIFNIRIRRIKKRR